MTIRSANATIVLSAILAVTVFGLGAHAATKLRAERDHRWEFVGLPGQETSAAVASRCSDCPVDLRVTCLKRGRGIVRLAVPAAAVSNGLDGAGKQIRIALDGKLERLRAQTRRMEKRGFVPILDLGADDPLLWRLGSAGTLTIYFYGQTNFVGLQGARAALTAVLADCLRQNLSAQPQQCTWLTIISCAPSPRTAKALWRGRALPARVDEIRNLGHCVIVPAGSLVEARRQAAAYGGHARRHCK